MMNVKPEELLKMLQAQEEFLKKTRRMSVKVGLPANKRGVMDGGVSVVQVGAAHEYGDRSFLRMPFQMRRKELVRAIDTYYQRGMNGEISAERALGIIGAYAEGISKQSFATGGFGLWPDISEETKRRKGSSKILIDKGVLQQNISWVLSDAS